jgi:hypothetical protein
MVKFKSRIAEPRAIYSRTIHGNAIAINEHDLPAALAKLTRH